jgi:hypothetical protein
MQSFFPFVIEAGTAPFLIKSVNAAREKFYYTFVNAANILGQATSTFGQGWGSKVPGSEFNVPFRITLNF